MTRTVKVYEDRRTEILDTAQQLFYTQGYENCSVRTIIDTIGIAKGTFYHYFDSKQALLDGVIERMVSQRLELTKAIIHNNELDALAKFNRFYGDLGSWKNANRAFFTSILPIFFADDNLLLRHKMQQASFARVLPLLTAVIQQGIAERVFDTDYPEDAAEIILSMGSGLSEAVADVVLKRVQYDDPLTLIKRKIAAYEQAVERTLGVQDQSLTLFAIDSLEAWLE